MKRIYLIGKHSDKYVLVDDEDYEWLNSLRWYYSTGYACHSYRIDGVDKKLYMHSYLMNTPPGYFTDHINGNPLDNRYANLRICTKYQNTLNRRVPTSNTSGYVGVQYHKRTGKWYATIGYKKKVISLGYYDTKEEAIQARIEGVAKYHGEYARMKITI
jgi:hypothetical protein